MAEQHAERMFTDETLQHLDVGLFEMIWQIHVSPRR